MSAKKINFNQNKEYDNGEKFKFRFEGLISNQNIDEEKINNLIESFMNNPKLHKNMVRNVAYLRTILKDFEEKLLVIGYSDANNQEIVKYDNGYLFLFECKNKSEENTNSMNAEFRPERGLSVSFSNNDADSIVDYPNSENMNEQFSELIKHIGLLKGAKAVNLDMDSKTLIEIYKLFYNENPNFSLSNINIRVQSMMSILKQFGISLGDDYTFHLWGKIPTSFNLEQIVNKLFLLGEITDIDDPVDLPDKSKKIIEIVGQCVREVINDGYNKDEALITISKIIYAADYNLSSNGAIKGLYGFTNLLKNEIESSIRLVKRIENKLNQSDK